MSINNSEIERVIENVNQTRPFSGVVLVKEKGDIIFEGAYGLANKSEQIANTMDTRFGIASGCKIFTAVAICQLVERGLLSFDTLIKDCLDTSFGEFDEKVTVHHLLTHSSGIPDYFDEETMDDYGALWNEKPMYSINGPKDFIPMFASQKMKFTPGDKFQYNNAGFIVLGLIVERVTGMRFIEYVEKNVFLACGMNDSGYFSLDRLPKNVAYGYVDNEDGSWKTNIYSIPIVGGPDGGAFVTASDMIKFWESFFAGKLVSKDLVDKIITDHILEENDCYYGYGIWIDKIDNEVFKYHVMGADPGVSFKSAVYPKQDVEIVIIANEEYGSYAITKGIEKLMLSNN